MPDYYVRQPSEETARGPYTLEKLASLADAGKVDTETLYYDEQMEAWVSIGQNEDLKTKLFPEKKKLSLKGRRYTSESEETDASAGNDESVSVENMLAAAEGQTAETEHLKEKARWQARAATISLPLLACAMAVSAASHIIPGIETIQKIFQPPEEAKDMAAYVQIIRQPIILLGFIDLIFALFLLLGSTGLYGVLRFRLMAGLGYFSVLSLSAYAFGDEQALLVLAASAIAHIAIFICTLTLHFTTVLVCSVLGIGGMFGYLYLTAIGPALGME